MIASALAALRDAWMLLTRIPLPRARTADTPDAARRAAPGWFPVVGLVLGATIAGVHALLVDLVGPFTSAAIAVSFGALLTGALHHDGLADVADSFGGGSTVERRLEILKDSRIGTYGALALMGAFVMQVSALAQHDRAQGFAVLVAAHTLGRGGVVVLMRIAPPAGGGGLGAAYARGLTTRTTVCASTSALVLATIVLGWFAAIATVAVAIAVGLTGWSAWRKIGGITGDVLGAAEQLSETAVLITGAALVRHAGSWPNGSWPWWR
jgi:adenosylcobinamide-GDP ribazoletransferase